MIFDLAAYKNFVINQVTEEAIYKKVNITERLIEALCQFDVAPSNYLADVHQKAVSRKYKQIIKTNNKPRSVLLNDWFLYNFGYKHCNKCKTVKALYDYQKNAKN